VALKAKTPKIPKTAEVPEGGRLPPHRKVLLLCHLWVLCSVYKDHTGSSFIIIIIIIIIIIVHLFVFGVQLMTLVSFGLGFFSSSV